MYSRAFYLPGSGGSANNLCEEEVKHCELVNNLMVKHHPVNKYGLLLTTCMSARICFYTQDGCLTIRRSIAL